MGDADATARDWPFVPVHRRIAETVARMPDAAAVEGADGALTYAALAARSAEVAAALRTRGVGRGSLVAVCLDRSARMVAALLGVLRAGAAYLPLDPEYPADRIAYMLDDSGAALLLTERALEPALPPSAVPRLRIEDVADSADSASTDSADSASAASIAASFDDDASFEDVEVDAEELAYVIYTSGSTGRPKGVMVRHGGVSSFLRSMAEAPGLRADDTLLALTTIAFDISVLELFLPLTVGARVVVAAREQAADPALLAARIESADAGVVQATPATWAMLLASGWTPRAGMRVLAGGEALPRPLADRLLAAGADLWNLYGPTETTIWSSTGRVAAEGGVTLGGPIANTTLYVLDLALNPAPLGVHGELFIGGAGVARGYLHRPALTAERFIPDPFGAPGSRLYRTGDRVRRRADGALEFGGRVDFQVKLRGFRIELGEIESALRAHPAVGAAVALVREDVPGDARLVAYLTPKDGGADPRNGADPPGATGLPNGAELRAHLRGRLPEYMVPSAFVALDAFPLTPNGKVDRRALPAPDGRVEARAYTAPRTPAEHALAEIWREVLRLDRVGLEDDFFELGGHSILATQVISRIRRELGVELPLRAVFEAGTVRALAGRLHGAQAADGPELAPVPRVARMPLSFAQERMWFLERMTPASGMYNMPDALALDGPLDVEALRRALEGLVARHEVLRTRYVETDGLPAQEILPPPAFHLPVEETDEADVPRRMREDARSPFDLATQIPLRARLLRLAPARHVLLLNVHHVAADGWSFGVLMRELTLLYRAAVRGEAAPLAPLPIQYADYAAWQRAYMHGAVMERQLDFWRARLRGAPALLELPYDRPRPAEQDPEGGVLHVTLPPEVTRAARRLARRDGATLYMVLLAAWKATLHRWSGETDVVVGSPIAGRARPETEGLVGLFVNTLALRTDLSGNPSFHALLARVRDTALEAYAHQDVPFEQMVHEAGVPRSLSHAPVVQVMFGLQNVPAGDLEMEGVRARALPAAMSTSRVDLTVLVDEAGDELGAYVEYARALWDADTVTRLMGHFGALLSAALAHPDVPVADLPLLDAAELARVTRELPAGPPARDTDRSIHALFAAAAAAAPDAVALRWDGGEMTYAALESRANRLARHLVARGARPGAFVGLLLERGPRMVEAMLAVLKAGGAYVPLDPAYPAARLAFMLSAGVELVVHGDESRAAAESLADELRTTGAPCAAFVDLDAAGDAIAASADAVGMDAAPGVDLGPDAPAYVIYTSGSTGRPKGVAVPHRAVVRLVREGGFADLGPDHVFLHLSTPSFDAATVEVWGPLLNGGRVAVHPPHMPSPAELRAFIRRQGVTTAFLTTGLFHLVADEAPDALHGVRHLMTGGDVTSIAHARRVVLANPGTRVSIVYGPTENTTFSTFHDLSAADWARASLPIGRPIAGTRAYVLDAAGTPAPVGVRGELHVGGEGLAWGYLGRPGLTAERFVPDPFGAPGSRLYRTGDRARWLPDGALEFMGRADRQVKIRGFRIEPDEVEAVAGAHPGVREAAVVVRGEGADKRLVAYVVPADGAAPTVAELRAYAAAHLPAYMAPSAWVVLDALPLTPSGKVDRRALPEPDASALATARVAPRTPAEELVAGIWEGVLGVRPGVTDSFFDLGGHSLRATQVVSRVADAFGVDLPLRALFEAPTVEGLAARAVAAKAGGTEAAPPLVPQPRDAAVPLSFAQQRFWFVEQMGADANAYIIPLALRLRGALDVDALRRALDGLVERHEALRTVFRLEADQPVQVVLPAASIDLPLHDLSDLAESERDAEALRITDAEVRARFDLARGPVFRARVIRLADEEHVVLLSLHHIVGDGWSLDVLLRELETLYAAARDGRDADLPPLPVQYADYALWQRNRLRGPALERELAHWRGVLDGAPTLDLPTDRPRPAEQTFRGGFVELSLGAELSERVAELARAGGATPYMALLATFALLLHRWSGAEDVVVGSPIAGRTPRETEGLIGAFVNTLALRVDLGGDPTFHELMARVRALAVDAYAHQEVPFERLVEELKVERSLSRHPLFQAVFSMVPAMAPGDRFAGLELRAGEPDVDTTKLDLVLALGDGPGGLEGGIQYASDLWDEATARRMAEHFRALLSSAVADPDARVSTLPWLSDAERALLEQWSHAAHDHDTAPLHRQVEAWAARQPEALAVSGPDGALTFAELDARANRLAHRLGRMGVGPESRVGVLLERSAALVVAQLAVMKAGGAYVPVDPAIPADRAAYILQASGAVLVVTTAALAGRMGDASVPALVLDDAAEADALAAESAQSPDVEVHPGNLAYVIFTSGSTGRPKGVAIPHGGVANTAGWFRRAHALVPGDRAVMHGGPGFDITLLEIWSALTGGAAVHVAPEAIRTDVPGLLRWMDAEGITLWAATAPIAEALMDAMDRGLTRPRALRMLTTGAEALRRRPPSWLPLLNVYGPTENSVASSAGMVPSEGAALPDIGAPLDNQRAWVLDAGLRRVPPGVPGELYMSGVGVGRGYLGRPGLTAEKFLPCPYDPAPGARMYATGDRVRWLPGGRLEYMGRVDDQVKLRGFRIEVGEIASALLSHPEVAQAVVVLRTGGGGPRLVAYVAGTDGIPAADAGALREHLRTRLPDYMVPSAFVALSALPLNSSGKVDRRALPAPPDDGAEYEPPATATETALAELWAELFPGRRIGREDGFFGMGGHSLLAMQLISRMVRAFGVEIPIRTLFEAPRLREMAARIDDAVRVTSGPEDGIEPADRGEPLPLSFAQERMWFLDRLLPGSAVYAMPLHVRLTGALDVEALRRALEDLVHRHEALRTVFPARGGRAVQVVTPPARFDLPLRDLSDLGAGAEAEAERLADEEARAPWDLAAGPLVRARLLRVSADGWMLLLTVHHIVADGWSLDVLTDELAKAYAARAAGAEPALPPLAVQYPDYAAWQRRRLSGERLDAQVAWWRQRLAGAPVVEVPADRPRPATPSFRGDWVGGTIGRETADRVEALAHAEGASRFQLLLAAFAILLHRWSGLDDVVVGSPVAGRGRAETERMVGLFVNTLALRTDVSGDPDFRSVVRRVRAATLEAYAHQEVPFERLVEEMRLERSLSRHPLFQVSFSVLPPAAEHPRLAGLKTEPVPSTTGTAKFDLVMEVEPNAEGLRVGVAYATDLYDAATARRLMDDFAALVQALVAAPDERISRLPTFLSDAERARVITEWSGTDAPVAPRTMHALVAEQAARTPDAVALSIGGRTVTYAEMEARANQLAHRLIAAGVGPETIVGLVAERAPETVIHTLAVLKAGGAYLPLDAAYPADRLRYMLADSRAALIVAPGGLPAGLADADLPPVVDLRAEADAIAAQPTTPPARRADVENVAYVIYTSGSTGRPKGVAVTHRGVANMSAWQHGRTGLRAGDRVLQFASYSFDAAVADVFPGLAAGATLVFTPREALMPGAALADTLRRERITFATIPPSALAVTDAAGLPELRVVLSAGEALPPAVAARWAAAVELHNGYGPTETTVSAASARVDAADPTIVIGRPIENARVYVLDAALRPVPVGAPGELCVGGVGIARGYLHRPSLTAERFVPDPFGAAGARLYRTGDRVRWTSGGVLEFLGRADEQVKVRGFRIEPGEIAARLGEVDGVRDALVLVRPDPRGDARLVAYVAAPDRAPSTTELRDHLRRVLPDYMVPQAYVVMDAFPQTPNGKTDRAALPAPADPSASPSAAPQGELEVAIAAVWREVLNLPSVGVNDSFFEIGGHSLLVAQLQDRLRNAIGREVSMVDLFQYPTVSALAAQLDAESRALAQADGGREGGAEKPAGTGRGAARRELLKRGRR
ncbi:MAG TPA: amino acid adenylation domain-containing protein [Longimicrobium sp.]|nr:amino acid adenylation domain-containing protein [Longimicrobium sp.]